MAVETITQDLSAFFESLEQRADGSAVANILEQLEDFDFEAAVVFSGDVQLSEGDDLFSDEFLRDRGADEQAMDAEKRLVVVLGNLVIPGDVALSEDYGLVFGDLTCRTLYVDGEALFGCTGTCTTGSIWSSYNGVHSCIQTAVTDYVVLSSDEMLEVAEAGCDLLCIDEGLGALVKANVLVPEITDAERPLHAFVRRMKDGEDLLKPGVTKEQLHRDLADTALIRKGDRVHLNYG